MKAQNSILLTLFLLFCNVYIFAQRERIWVMTNNTGIDFNDGSLPPTAFSVNVFSAGANLEANAAVCDTNGNFLFYTDGNKVWDQNYNTMQNGQDLVSSSFYDLTSSVTQGALIVPMPDSAHKYYIFSLTGEGFSNGGSVSTWGRLYYSVVDMNLNNGIGAVVAGEKGVFVDSNLQEKMVSVVGDRCNIWVLTCGYDGKFRAYEITAAGIQVQPIVSTTGIGDGASPGGMIAVSPDRTRIAAARWWKYYVNLNLPFTPYGSSVALFDFDPATGLVSNPISLRPYSATGSPGSDSIAYGVCFSPDGSKLYCTGGGGQAAQFDLSAGGLPQILNSQTYVGQISSLGTLRLRPDGKIYFVNNSSFAIGAIEFPNRAGTACQVNPNVVSFSAGAWPYSLPNVVSELKRTHTKTVHHLERCNTPSDSSVLLVATDTLGWGYTWSDGAEGTSTSVNASGTYWVQYHTPPCVFHTDTFNIIVGHMPPAAITVDTFVLRTTFPYDTYQWYLNGNIIPGATERTYTVTENGDYTVVVGENTSGCTDTSEVYEVTNVTGIDQVNYLKQSIKIYPNPAHEIIHIQSPVGANAKITDLTGRILISKSNAEAIHISSLSEGVYFICLYDKDGLLTGATRFVKK